MSRPHGTLVLKSGTDFREFSVLRLAVPASLQGAPGGCAGSGAVHGAVRRCARWRRLLAACCWLHAAVADAPVFLPPCSPCHRLRTLLLHLSSCGLPLPPGLPICLPSPSCFLADRPPVEWERVEITSAVPEDAEVAAIVRKYQDVIGELHFAPCQSRSTLSFLLPTAAASVGRSYHHHHTSLPCAHTHPPLPPVPNSCRHQDGRAHGVEPHRPGCPLRHGAPLGVQPGLPLCRRHAHLAGGRRRFLQRRHHPLGPGGRARAANGAWRQAVCREAVAFRP